MISVIEFRRVAAGWKYGSIVSIKKLSEGSADGIEPTSRDSGEKRRFRVTLQRKSC